MSASTPATLAAATQITISATRAMLHLTNGTSVIPSIRAAGLAGPIVPWNDVLHEGPVPAGLGPAAMRERRAAFLAGCGWGSYQEIARELERRDAALEDALFGGGFLDSTFGGTEVPPSSLTGVPPSDYDRRTTPVDEIVLWFEHDLFDQLHLLQILDRIPLDCAARVTAVPDTEYLGTLPPSRFQGLFAARREVTSAQHLAARDGWEVFRSADPRDIIAALPRLTELDHLGPALLRHAEQFPSVKNGLSRTEQQALEVVASGVGLLRDVYLQSHHGSEPAIFMGDTPFLMHLASLLKTPRPLLRTVRPSTALSLKDDVELTDDGRRVLQGQLDRVSACGLDRWLGGVHLSGHGPVWRWDADRQTFRAR